MPKLESQCDRPRDGPPWQLPMSITSIPHLAKKKSVVPSAWHLPSVPVPGLTLSRCKSCVAHLDLSATVHTSASSLFTSSRRRDREPGHSQRVHLERNPPRNPLPQIVVIPSLPAPVPPPIRRASDLGFRTTATRRRHGLDGVASLKHGIAVHLHNGNLETRAPLANRTPNHAPRWNGSTNVESSSPSAPGSIATGTYTMAAL